MRRGDKPFVSYTRGPMSFIIVPRGLKGWAQFGLWIALLVPHVAWFEAHLRRPETASETGAAVFLFLTGLLAWVICGLWYMLAHAEVVDVAVLKRERQRQRRKQQRQGSQDLAQ